jgi:hypothetical protein
MKHREPWPLAYGCHLWLLAVIVITLKLRNQFKNQRVLRMF